MSSKLKFGILNILIILLVGAIGIFAVVVSLKNIGKTTPQEAAEILDGQVQKLNELGASDEIPSIEAELNSTSLDDLDQGVAEVDNSLQGL
ncbi:hypothetical protein A3I53_01725 [Candidatus Curtissbacteria bacterium RIFCSPLOWO2_02_FULL_40_13b]|uniref:Uncharacterized protein n=3 Tax=Candidatus Curtissiibacteriota TaxID=1752717 RepID=A0A1F5HXC7_9BACT|nr:MAG: hypothetical protein A2693_04910 [Candidatus Curtissbacteria bacterium RIFCSPHIGHO2_01_FULL_40_12]OGE04861.1 MAG: hypothetical protein A3F45_01340 [Candidatus Curtissbacteria bacterium RIFCSPHIGHO2_12_FULL_41_17]OGE08842.1 MAG: hypothetical protein A3I53_01725 [Candidatus Curtissbacteria bacterium RIFCSPLOWO2_02_FULL_40_13b]